MKSRLRSAMTATIVAGLGAGVLATAAPATAAVVSLPPVQHAPTPAASCTSTFPVGATRIAAKICTTREQGRVLAVGSRVLLSNPSRMTRTAEVTLKTTAVFAGRPFTRMQSFTVTVPGGGSIERALTITPGTLKGSVSGAATVSVRGVSRASVHLSSPTMRF